MKLIDRYEFTDHLSYFVGLKSERVRYSRYIDALLLACWTYLALVFFLRADWVMFVFAVLFLLYRGRRVLTS